MAARDLDVIKDIPGFKVILKTVLKAQIQQLVEQLAAHTDEESVILTASVSDGTISHLGSDSGKGFLEEQENIKTQFLSFCLKRHYQNLQDKERERQTAMASQAPLAGQFDYGPGPRHHPQMPYHTSPLQPFSPQGGFNVRSQRHEPYPILRPNRRTSFTESSQGPISSPLGESVARKTDTDNQEGNESVNKDNDNINFSFGASEQSGCKADEKTEDSPEIDPNVVKVEAISESDLELENTGVETGQSVHQDNLDPNVSVGMNFNLSQGTSGNMADADAQQNLELTSGLARNICPVCTRAVQSAYALKVHMRCHSGEQPHQCSKCNKRFSQSSSLNRHLKTHMKMEPYQCSKCNNRFSQSSSLKRHIKTHLKMKPYKCSLCEGRFSQRSHLKRHAKSHLKK